ncbi:hypothetical protein [Aurantimonas coralicida]|uniref:hypothetical protein n=1 Tax=Aurantimonas coralicida TaxID=182270 RepID=UPI0023A10445|nr:hypothetical protein [Aurantimonas coralicida]MDE0922517.1 hypothetical protein [Aurantimonas coralicida]
MSQTADKQLTYAFQHVPTLYAEGIAHAGFMGPNVKLHFVRQDSPLEGGDSRQETAVTQIIMPVDAIVNTAVFLEFIVRDMVASGAVPQARVDELRKSFDRPAEK